MFVVKALLLCSAAAAVSIKRYGYGGQLSSGYNEEPNCECQCSMDGRAWYEADCREGFDTRLLSQENIAKYGKAAFNDWIGENYCYVDSNSTCADANVLEQQKWYGLMGVSIEACAVRRSGKCRIDQYNEKVNFVKKEQNDDDDTIEVTEDDIGIPVAGMTYREYQYQYGNVDQDYYVY